MRRRLLKCLPTFLSMNIDLSDALGHSLVVYWGRGNLLTLSHCASCANEDTHQTSRFHQSMSECSILEVKSDENESNWTHTDSYVKGLVENRCATFLHERIYESPGTKSNPRQSLSTPLSKLNYIHHLYFIKSYKPEGRREQDRKYNKMRPISVIRIKHNTP